MIWVVPFVLLGLAGYLIYRNYAEIRAISVSVKYSLVGIGLLCGVALGWQLGVWAGFFQGVASNFP